MNLHPDSHPDSHPDDDLALPFVKEAEYVQTPSQRYAGNPLVEALDPVPSDLGLLYANLPPVPTDATRQAPSSVRNWDLNQLHDVVVPFPEYESAATAIHTLVREAYHYRNPFTAAGRIRRYEQAYAATGQYLQSNRKSTARGHIIMAISGMGKTTFANSVLHDFPPLIRHTAYQGKEFKAYQIPVITLRIPHDGTIRSLCIQFFDAVDQRMKTTYAKMARGRVSIGPMVDLMKQVATAVSLGLLIVDEVQNLRTARSGQAELVLNLFTEIIEKVGISILVIATPALQPIIEGSVRNTRKLVSGGCSIISAMREQDDVRWRFFTDTLWDYQYLQQKAVLTEDVRRAWHEMSGGNVAFASLLFYMAQRAEIGGREVLDVESLNEAYAMNLSFLHPAITALRSGKPSDLQLFDDLIVSERWTTLRQNMGVVEEHKEVAPVNEPEFLDLGSLSNDSAAKPAKAPAPSPEANRAAGKSTAVPAPAMPVENPFNQTW